MPNNNPVFVFDGKLCKFEGMTREQIINAIAEATGVTPTDVDEGFISTLVEQNKGKSVHFWFGSQAEYDALESYDSNTFYIIDGDATIDDLEAAIMNAENEIDEVRDDIQDIQGEVSDIQGDVSWLRDSYVNDFTIGGKPHGSSSAETKGWTKYTGGAIQAGLYVVYIVDTTISADKKTANSFLLFISNSNYNEKSSTFTMYDGGSYSVCYLHVNFYNGDKTLSVQRTSNASIMQGCDIYLHKIGSIEEN